MLDEEVAGGVRLAPQLVDPCGKIDHNVGVGVEQLADRGQILGMIGHVGQEERRLGMEPDHPVPLLEQIPLGEVRSVEAPGGKLLQGQVVLVGGVDRQEEGRRIGNVDQDRDLQLTGPTPNGKQALVVDAEHRALGVPKEQAQLLRHFEPARSLGHVLFQMFDAAIGEAIVSDQHGIAPLGKIGHREGGKPARIPSQVVLPEVVEVAAGDGVGVVLQRERHVAGHVHPDPHAHCVHDLDERFGRQVAEQVVVGVDGGKAGLLRHVSRHLQQALGPIVSQQHVALGRIHPGRLRFDHLAKPQAALPGGERPVLSANDLAFARGEWARSPSRRRAQRGLPTGARRTQDRHTR